MISEREMEDQIADAPERFLEQNLTLVSRQFRIGPYIFDLVFEDRHGGKLIVEIQKGTLDREHTYKILDYYDEYRDRHPGEFVELLIVANCIPVERKKRLAAHGIAYREIPECHFQQGTNSEVCKSAAPLAAQGSRHAEPANKSSTDSGNGLGSDIDLSDYAIEVQKALQGKLEAGHWRIGGNGKCVTVNYLPVTLAIASEGFGSQIWIDRNYRCTFEIFKNDANKNRREEIAATIKVHLKSFGLPEIVQFSTGSTIVRLPRDLARNVEHVVSFALWLDRSLDGAQAKLS